MTEWSIGKIKKITYWTENLFSIILNAKINNFYAGQFTRLALKINNKKIKRAYSYINSPQNKNYEFYISNIKNGKLSTNLYNLKVNDKIFISKNSSGIFTLNNIKSCENLWMLSTGTGIGPYLSILQDKICFKKFSKIILVHSIRYIKDFSYLNLLKKIQNKYFDQLIIQVILTRNININKNILYGYIPNLIKNGKLEKKIGLKINNNNSHVMLCGNPEMIKQTQNFLEKTRNLSKNLKKQNGNITSERYW
ncbi:ferredoxin--NADP(+) reductase [Enterobacteriaceae endosymbiont of Donacia bicoloricornis]|uniref:FAD-binding oxidoreductase n=1 Tax=Enterobacteriaceae endosymbiont of Donacia bicoloricornis TaxID=2675772 RepID=UPI001449F099|nr:FAD-binding oxidoreductase [Enterobacteriaceae endosymbiont of Donacia bicoloricornis]QJC37720.1 ferredoxin--NADP(+) reductase [Enterobacteriaceae endosymbiont of Donacia bicoloricornis]